MTPDPDLYRRWFDLLTESFTSLLSATATRHLSAGLAALELAEEHSKIGAIEDAHRLRRSGRRQIVAAIRAAAIAAGGF